MLEIEERVEAADPGEGAATLCLSWEKRQRGRQLVRLEDGRQAALLLPRGATLLDGDLLRTAQGELVRVKASAEDLSEVACADALALARACYHLGNRHVPAQITPGAVRYQRDHVLDAMLRGLGLQPRPLTAAFQPEPGAYQGPHATRREGVAK